MDMHVYNGKRIDITQPFVGPDGRHYGLNSLAQFPEKMAEYGFKVIPEPVRPADFTPDTYRVDYDNDTEPFVIYTRRTGDEMAAMFETSKGNILSSVRAARDVALGRLMGIAFSADKSGDSPTVEACLAARESLLNITAAPGVLVATDAASLKAALLEAYTTIVDVTPVNVRGAFAGFNV